MSHETAYISSFRSIDDTLWSIQIRIENSAQQLGRPVEIKLEADEPCVIEWQETDKTDVLQPSTCTLRVSNESDRQMVRLMTDRKASLFVFRNGAEYWRGTLDDAVYEEPYSFTDAYVTELTFSDFGILNRLPFGLAGKQSLLAVVNHCLDGSGLDYLYQKLLTSLSEPKSGETVTLGMIYVNADRFADDGKSWGSMTTKREVLEEALRPLGLRIVQKNGVLHIYDADYLRDHDEMHSRVVWKGTDAALRGSETYGWFEVAFDTDTCDTLAEETHDLDDEPDPRRFYARYVDEEYEQTDPGFFIGFCGNQGPYTPHRVFNTQARFSESSGAGYAWRVRADDALHPTQVPPLVLGNDIVTNIAGVGPVAQAMFAIASGYVPLVPDRERFMLRVNLDLLLSPKLNPLEGDEDWNTRWHGNWNEYGYGTWKDKLLHAYVPVKLELLDEHGTVLMHYVNTRQGHQPIPAGKGYWTTGAATFGDMLLAYWRDGLDATALDGWATNRQSTGFGTDHLPGAFRKKADGEYAPLPPEAGVIRLTVSNCVFTPDTAENAWLNWFAHLICWHLVRNAKISIAVADDASDSGDTGTVYEREKTDPMNDHLSETLKAGCWRKGIAPSARGLLFTAGGTVWETFVKNGSPRTLQEHRLRFLEDQTALVQPVISGTAELGVQFCAYRENSTPGVFIVTALRQDLRQDTEEVTMARIAPVGGFVHEFAWSDPFCAEQEEPHRFAWSSPLCAKEPGPYSFAWSVPRCAKQYNYSLDWEEMQTYD